MPQYLSNDLSTLVQVIVCCRQPTSLYLNQCCPRCMSPYGVTRPQWINIRSSPYVLVKTKIWIHVFTCNNALGGMELHLNNPEPCEHDWHNVPKLEACKNVFFLGADSRPRFNIKMTSYRYRKSHCGDKTVVRSSYLRNGISFTGKM